MEDSNSVVITGGGWTTTSQVTRYSLEGWVEDLAPLITARHRHACALYSADTGGKVYLVMGGTDSNGEPLSSTEQYSPGEQAWREATPLPRELHGLRAATLRNIVYLTGEVKILLTRSSLSLNLISSDLLR